VPTVLLFGLCNAPAHSQRQIRINFAEFLEKYRGNTNNYMDDFWIATEDSPEGVKCHMQVIYNFLDTCEKKSYFLKPSKCQILQWKITLLGWEVTPDGLKIDPDKIAGIAEWLRTLRVVKEIQQALGVLGYQCPFIRGFVQLACPLTELTKKSVPFRWTECCC
jgi:hypothetical protein